MNKLQYLMRVLLVLYDRYLVQKAVNKLQYLMRVLLVLYERYLVQKAVVDFMQLLLQSNINYL